MSKDLSSAASEWDVMMGIGMLGLPFVHTVETFMLCELVSSEDMFFCDAIMALTVFGPSIFMLGMGVKLTRQSNVGLLLRYGRILFFIGILLNLLRSIIPAILVAAVAGSTVDHLLSFLFLSDIYLFAGLFYILLGLFRKMGISTYGIVIVAVIMLIANCLLGGMFRTEFETINAILGNIVYIDDGSVFPLLSWTVFPAFGMMIGEVFNKKSRDEIDGICRKSLLVVLIVLAVTVSVMSLKNIDPVTIAVSPMNEYRTDIINVIMVLCLNIIAIVLIRFIISKFESGKASEWLARLSANIMIFYFLHWCILTLICYVTAAVLTLNGSTANVGLMIGIALVVEILTIIVVKKWGYSIMKFILRLQWRECRWGDSKC